MERQRRNPPVPREKGETERREILSVLRGEPLTAKDISGYVHLPEKKVYDHLEHIRKTVEHAGLRLEVIPAECRLCGFVFAKRDRLGKPGKCPVCRKQSIAPPRFAVLERPG